MVTQIPPVSNQSLSNRNLIAQTATDQSTATTTATTNSASGLYANPNQVTTEITLDKTGPNYTGPSLKIKESVFLPSDSNGKTNFTFNGQVSLPLGSQPKSNKPEFLPVIGAWADGHHIIAHTVYNDKNQPKWELIEDQTDSLLPWDKMSSDVKEYQPASKPPDVVRTLNDKMAGTIVKGTLNDKSHTSIRALVLDPILDPGQIQFHKQNKS